MPDILAWVNTLADCTDGTPNAGTRTAQTTASRLAPYVQEGVTIQGDDPGIEVSFTARGELHISFHTWNDVSSGAQPFCVVRSGTTELFRVMPTGTPTVGAEYWDGSAWQEVGAKTSMPRRAVHRHDLYIDMANSGGTITYWLDDTQVHTFSGDTILDTPTDVDNFLLTNNTTSSAQFTDFSGIFLADVQAETIEMDHKRVSGDSATNTDWSNGFGSIDESGVDDADFVQSTAADEVSTYTRPAVNSDFDTGFDVVGVGVSVRGAKGSASPGFLKPCIYSDATLGEGGSKSLGTTFAKSKQHFFALDPDGSVAWTVAQVNAGEPGMKSAAA